MFTLNSAPTLPLAGLWRVELDPANTGEAERWFSRELSGWLTLPGTLDIAGIGEPNSERNSARLSRKVRYLGAAWYSREIDIPADWTGGHGELILERALWKTSVWLDDLLLGSCDSLSTSHHYTFIPTPGRHKLTVRVDNSRQNNICGHAYSEMQTIWNGLLGQLKMCCRTSVYCAEVQVFGDIQRNAAEVKLCISNQTGAGRASRVNLQVVAPTGGIVNQTDLSITAGSGETQLNATLALGPDAVRWSEFTPLLYTLKIVTESTAGKEELDVRFGLREFSCQGTQFTINGQPTFLRGEHDTGGNALLGHPSMNLADWRRIFTIGREWGMNHWRFHSWCPPEAAFQAADEAGIYLQPELPLNGDLPVDAKTHAYLVKELGRIIRTYGNHPSFVLFSNGNELRGDVQFLRQLTQLGQSLDAHRLWTIGTNAPWETPTVPGPDDPEDFFVGSMTKDFDHTGVNQEEFLRGSYHWHTMGHINNRPPSTQVDYRVAVAKCAVPALSHEVGQYCSYPNLQELKKYTGVLTPRNYELISESLLAHHLFDQAEAFRQASGQLVWRLYKEEIEAALRTSGMAGFQLLDLRDNQDQGTAVVGLLDVFWDNKGFLTPDQFRQFCSPIVPLLRMEKLTWANNETLLAEAEVAHFGPADLPDSAFVWTIYNTNNEVVACGSLNNTVIAKSGLRSLGSIAFQLNRLASPAKYRITLGLPETSILNSWDFWVYPARIATTTPDNIVVATGWAEARTALATGAKVLFLVSPEEASAHVAGAFQTDFWCYAMFKQFNPPGTLGLLCDPAHPALANFPTDSHADWQWWDLLKNSCSLILDSTPPEFKPVVQMIDTYGRNHKLGNLLEAQVGTGRLMVCSIDLSSDLANRIVAAQLRRSLVDYIASPQFAPRQELMVATLDTLFSHGDQAAGATNYQICLHDRSGQTAPTIKIGFAALVSTATEFRAKCPPGFNGLLRVRLQGNGEAKVFFLNREETPVTLDELGKWVEFSTAQRAWMGELEFKVVPTTATVADITEWMIVE